MINIKLPDMLKLRKLFLLCRLNCFPHLLLKSFSKRSLEKWDQWRNHQALSHDGTKHVVNWDVAYSAVGDKPRTTLVEILSP